MSGALAGKTGLVMGVANARSIAWHTAQRAAAAGAKVALTYAGTPLARRVEPLAESIGAAWIGACDVSDDAALDTAIADAAEALGGRIDFLVHAVAYAARDALTGSFADTSRADFVQALDVSVFSLVAAVKRAAPFMTEGGAVVTFSYVGAERAVPGYQVMGVAKAALESAVRYLAAELGPRGVRVNAVSAGPVRTLSAAGIPGFRDMMKHARETAPLGRDTDAAEVADAAVFLLSPAARAITGEILHVDGGFHAMGI